MRPGVPTVITVVWRVVPSFIGTGTDSVIVFWRFRTIACSREVRALNESS